jgi:hypothetical protein
VVVVVVVSVEEGVELDLGAATAASSLFGSIFRGLEAKVQIQDGNGIHYEY